MSLAQASGRRLYCPPGAAATVTVTASGIKPESLRRPRRSAPLRLPRRVTAGNGEAGH